MKVNQTSSHELNQALAKEQMPKKKNKVKVGKSGGRSIHGPLKKENIFSSIKKRFALALWCKKIKKYSVSAHELILKEIPLNKIEKYKALGVDKEFSYDTVNAAKKVDQEGESYNEARASYKKLLASTVKQQSKKVTLDLKAKEMQDKVVKKQGGVDYNANKVMDTSKIEISLALNNLYRKKGNLDIAKNNFYNSLNDSIELELQYNNGQYIYEESDALQKYQKSKKLLITNYNKDLAELNNSIKDLSEEKDAAVIKKDNDKKRIDKLIKGKIEESSEGTISELKTAVSTGRDKIEKCESLLKEKRKKKDELNKKNAKENKACDKKLEEKLKRVDKRVDTADKVIDKKYEKLFLLTRRLD